MGFERFFNPIAIGGNILQGKAPFSRKGAAKTSKFLKEGLLGKSPETQQLPTGTPEQSELNQLIIQRLKDLLSPEAGEQRGEAAAQTFREQTVPSLAERFTSLGGGGGLSSAFGQQLAQAQQGTEAELSFERTLLPLLLSGALSSQFENILIPGSEGILQKLFSAGGQAAGAAVKGAMLG